jgi:hypothetical protein
MRAFRFAVAAFLFTAAAYAGTGTFFWSGGYTFYENQGSVGLTVFRAGGTSGTVTVDYATANGTATAGVQYTATSGTLTFLDGETTKIVTIPLIDNSTWDGGGYNTFTAQLSNPSPGTFIGNSGIYTVYVYDNDPAPTVSVNNVQIPEGNSGTTNANFTVTVTGNARTANVNVTWYTYSGSAYAGSDFVSSTGSLTFTPSDTQKTLSVQIIGDTVYEPDENFYVSLSSNALVGSGGNCIIVNDDPKPSVAITGNVSVSEGDSGRKAVTLTLTPNQPIYGYLNYNTVNGTAVAGRDYDAVSSYLYWSGQTSQTVTLQIIGDTDVEADEQFTLHFNVDPYYNFTLSQPDVPITIMNDDQGLGPATQNVAKGSSAAVILDVGNPTPSPQPIAVSVSDPCISAPSSATLTGRSVAIPVQALTAPCSANVDVTLPAALGGKKFSAGIRTYNPLTITFNPASPQVYVGQTATVHVTVSPFDAPVALPLAVVGDTAEVPASVNVDAGGGNFTVKGLKAGTLMINATLPPQNGNGTATLFGNILAAPTTVTILKVAPASGPTAGGTTVTLTGANFRADCTIAFGGIPATNVAYQSATSMTAAAPAHVAGSVDVTASCGTETYTLPNAFSYLAGSATITGVTPSFGSTLGGTMVRIAGRDFAAGCWAFFDGVAARNVSVNGTTEVVAGTPAHAAAAVAVSVRCAGGAEASLGSAFNYSAIDEPPPSIASVTPLAAAPGQSVTINGSRFRANDTVTFGTAAAPLLSTAPDAHVVTVPALPLGKVSINVADGSGRVSTTGPIFTVLEPLPPQITRATPATVPPGGEISIDGSGFRDPYTFALGNAPLRVKKESSTSVVVAVPATVAPGTYELHVVNGSGAVAAIGPNVTVAAGGIVITSVSPVCATTDGGTAIAIAGSGFPAGAAVTVNGVAATNVHVADAAHITATLPALAPGLATVAVNGATATNALRVYSPFDPDGCGMSPRPRPIRR